MWICYQNHLSMQLWNINSFKQIYHTILRKKNANQCIWVQCTKLASWRITHKVYKLWGSTWCRSLWTDSWTTVSLSALNLKEVAQWRNVEKLKKIQLHANALWQVGPTTDSQIFSIRFPCFTAQTSFSLPSPTKKIKMEERLIATVKVSHFSTVQL